MLAAAAVACGVGIREGTFAAADTDPFGYVSEADLIAQGSLRIEQQFVRTLPWPYPEWTFAPHGYVPRPGGFIVPTYPPGLPLVMAIFQRMYGRGAVFYVVPLLGAWTVLMAGWLGTKIYGAPVGALASVVTAASPIFLNQVVQPVSDVAAAAWWTTALALAVGAGPAGAFAAGLAASMGTLTRPNLVILAVVIAAYLAYGDRGTLFRRRAVWFAMGVLPGCLGVAATNAYLYGSPMTSGYGRLSDIYALANVLPNLDRYPRWLIESETPLIALSLVAPWLSRPRRADSVWLVLTFAAVLGVSYLLYSPWGREEWGYLRFLLPGIPAAIVLATAVALELLRRAVSAGWHVRVGALLCALLVWWQVGNARGRGVFNLDESERRYVDVARYVRLAMPDNAVFIAGAETGSIRYYSGRLTLQYDLLGEGWLDEAVTVLRARGYRPFILLERDEEAPFRQRFADRNALGRLDWPPAVERLQSVPVRIYDPDDRARFVRGEGIVTGDVGFVGKPWMTVKR